MLLSILLKAETSLLTVNCGSTQVSESAKKESPVLPASEESFTNAERMGEMVNYLASNDLKGRDTGSEGIAMAAKYIENYFKSYGCGSRSIIIGSIGNIIAIFRLYDSNMIIMRPDQNKLIL